MRGFLLCRRLPVGIASSPFGRLPECEEGEAFCRRGPIPTNFPAVLEEERGKWERKITQMKVELHQRLRKRPISKDVREIWEIEGAKIC